MHMYMYMHAHVHATILSYSFKKFLDENSSIADVVSKEEYDEICREVGSKEGVCKK